MKLFVRAFLDTLFPPLCHCCKRPMPGAGQLHLCTACLESVSPIVSPLCPCCGTPFVTEGGADHPCGPCSLLHPPYDASRSAVRFSGAARELIHRFKYDNKNHLAHPLALLTASSLTGFVRSSSADCIIPVPLHARRLRERGFNQAVLLGEMLSRNWRIPLRNNNLRRIRWTEPQINLKAQERDANVRGAFALHDPNEVRGQRIILLDDVYTTGSTVCECARTLRNAGAAGIFTVTVARAVE